MEVGRKGCVFFGEMYGGMRLGWLYFVMDSRESMICIAFNVCQQGEVRKEGTKSSCFCSG